MMQNPLSRCEELIRLGELELRAFVQSITELFGAEQARVAVEDWLESIVVLDCDSFRPDHSWRLVTVAATIRFLNRVIMKSDLRAYGAS